MPKLFSTVLMRATKSLIMGASFDKIQTSQNHQRPAETPSIPDRQTQGKKGLLWMPLILKSILYVSVVRIINKK